MSAARTAQQEGLAPIGLEQADACALPSADASFDRLTWAQTESATGEHWPGGRFPWTHSWARKLLA